MAKDSVNRKLRPKSMYDNVQYSPDSPPSWQYYRCMSFLIKFFQLLFAGLVFIFSIIWVQENPEGDRYYGAAIWVLLCSFLALCVTVILLMSMCCCTVWMVKRLTQYFCVEFFIHIFMIVIWFFASMVAIIFAVLFPKWYIICACVFSFFAQLMYSVDCNFNFIYWRESKRRDVFKHSKPFADEI